MARVIRCMGRTRKMFRKADRPADRPGRDEDRHPIQRPEIADQLGLQRRVGQHDLDELGLAEARLGHHPDHAALAGWSG
jgi:hypothetical protein